MLLPIFVIVFSVLGKLPNTDGVFYLRPCFDLALFEESVTCINHAGYRNNITVAVNTNSSERCRTCGGDFAYYNGAYEKCIIQNQTKTFVGGKWVQASETCSGKKCRALCQFPAIIDVYDENASNEDICLFNMTGFETCEATTFLETLRNCQIMCSTNGTYSLSFKISPPVENSTSNPSTAVQHTTEGDVTIAESYFTTLPTADMDATVIPPTNTSVTTTHMSMTESGTQTTNESITKNNSETTTYTSIPQQDTSTNDDTASSTDSATLTTHSISKFSSVTSTTDDSTVENDSETTTYTSIPQQDTSTNDDTASSTDSAILTTQSISKFSSVTSTTDDSTVENDSETTTYTSIPQQDTSTNDDTASSTDSAILTTQSISKFSSVKPTTVANDLETTTYTSIPQQDTSTNDDTASSSTDSTILTTQSISKFSSVKPTTVANDLETTTYTSIPQQDTSTNDSMYITSTEFSNSNTTQTVSLLLTIEDLINQLIFSSNSTQETFSIKHLLGEFQIQIFRVGDTTQIINISVEFLSSALLHISATDGSLNETLLAGISELLIPYEVYDRILASSQNVLGTSIGSSSQLSTIYLAPTNTPLISISLYYSNGSIAPAAVEYSVDVSGDTALLGHVTEEICNPKSEDTSIILQAEYECAYIDVQTLSFSTEGCTSVPGEDSTVICKCQHTTVFAVLLSVTTVTIPYGVKISSYVTESISVVSLGITILILLRLRKVLKGDRTMVQINLAISLLFLHLITLLHDHALPLSALCEMTAILTHFFLLTSAMWMLLEGVTLCMKTLVGAMRSSDRNEKRITMMRLSAGWFFPAFLVLIASAVGFSRSTYLSPSVPYQKGVSSGNADVNCGGNGSDSLTSIPKYDVCWVSNTYFLRQGSVLVPLAIIFFLNTLMCVWVGTFVYRMTVKAENFRPSNAKHVDMDHIKAATKAVLFLLPVLGVPWTIGFLIGITNQTATIVFMYINSVVNGTQGLFLFLLYCVISKETRSALLKSWSRGKVNISTYLAVTKERTAAFVSRQSEGNIIPLRTMDNK